MRRVFALLVCGLLALAVESATVVAQATVPVVTLPRANAVSAQKFGGIIGVRELPGGKLLVDDGGYRQLTLLDTALTTIRIILDSTSVGPNSYGRRAAPIIPYLGDSTLFPDYGSLAMLVLDERGQISRSLALPTPADLGMIRRGTGVDAAGRLVYLGEPRMYPSTVPGELPTRSDSVPLLRADFDARRTDTIAQLMRPHSQIKATSPDGGAILAIWIVDQLRTIDDWAILSDGSVAIVRGHDYHLDWLRPNNTQVSTAKLPFDWISRTDADKQRMIDSTRTVLRAAMDDGSIVNRVEMMSIIRTNSALLPSVASGGRAGGNGGGRGGGRGGTGTATFQGFSMLAGDTNALRKLSDYYPPLRNSSTLADLSGNLWILPTTSRQSLRGELVYDVVNVQGQLVRRVRVPLGQLIVGFGKGDVVYLTSGDIVNGFRLERSKAATIALPSR